MRFDRALLLLLAQALAACGAGSALPGLATRQDRAEACTGYPQVAQYALPWAVATSFVLIQGNCGADEHKGLTRYAYDFAMPVGTQVLAARAGTVTAVTQTVADGVFSSTNYVEVTHADGTVASYQHLTQNGAQVAVGTYVTLGQALGLSGSNGISRAPHLHFEVRTANSGVWESVPVSFANSGSAVSPLVEGSAYPLH